MKTFRQALTVGKEHQGMDMYASIKLDGEEKQRFKCDSFVGRFANLLQGLMHGGYGKRLVPGEPHGRGNLRGYEAENITDATNASPIKISSDAYKDGLVENWIDHESIVIVWGVQGNTAANGFCTGVRDGWGIELYDFDGNPIAGNGEYTGGGKVMVLGWKDKSIRQAYKGLSDIFINWHAIVGSSTQPVGVNDYYLGSRIQHGGGDGQLSHGGTSISSITTDKPTSRFTISKPFTNNGTVDVEVNEIGIASQSNNDNENVNNYGRFMARDVLPETLTVPPGKTLTVDYELVVRLSPDTQDTETDGTNGGLLDGFMAGLRRIVADTGGYTHQAVFNLSSPPGRTGNVNEWESQQGWQKGIRVGADQSFVSMTDDGLKSYISHGEEAGQLYHYGCDVENVVVDEANDIASYDITRILENRTNDPITIKEIGLLANISANNEAYSALNLIARTALNSADFITVPAGKWYR